MGAFVYIFTFLFISIFVFVIYIISKMSWADLVDTYQYNDKFVGERLGIVSGAINSASYRNSVVLKYNEERIYLQPILLFRFFHKPILIPWTEIKDVRSKKILFTNFKELVIGTPFVALLSLGNSTFSKIEDHLPSSLTR